jgi:hypothetical protein
VTQKSLKLEAAPRRQRTTLSLNGRHCGHSRATGTMMRRPPSTRTESETPAPRPRRRLVTVGSIPGDGRDRARRRLGPGNLTIIMLSSDDEGLGWLGRRKEVGHGHGRRQHDSDDSDESPGQLPDRRPAAPVYCGHGVTVISDHDYLTAAWARHASAARGWRSSDGIRVADSRACGPAEVTRPRRAPNALAVTRSKPRRARAAGQTKRLCARVRSHDYHDTTGQWSMPTTLSHHDIM